MGRFLKFVFLILTANLGSAISEESPYLPEILFYSDPIKNNMTSCLVSMVRELNASYIGIRMDSQSKREFQDTINGLIILNNEVTYNLDFEEQKDYNVDCWFYFIDSAKSLDLLVKRQLQHDDSASSEEQNYIIILSSDIRKLKKILKEIFQLCLKNFILNVNVLVEDNDGTIMLNTYFPLTKDNCKDVMPRVYNRFQNGHFESKKTTFPSKTSNFWKCRMRALIFEVPAAVNIDQDRIYGPDIDLYVALATLMNFSLEFIASPEGRGELYANKTLTGSLKLLQDRQGDVLLIIATSDQYKQFLTTTDLKFVNVYIVFKRRKSYNSLEILLFPFDTCTWIGIFGIFIGKFLGQWLCRRFTTNSVAPSVHFKRLCLTLWLLSILVLSSSYSGSLFKLLQNPPLRPLPRTVTEAMNQGYKLIVPKFAVSFIGTELKNNLIVVDSDFEGVFNYFDSLEGKYGYIMWETGIRALVAGERLKEFFILPAPLQQNVISIHMRKHFYLAKEMNKFIQGLKENGLLWRIISPEINQRLETSNRKQHILTLQQLLGSFQLLCILIILSTGVFFAELISKNSPRLRYILRILE